MKEVTNVDCRESARERVEKVSLRSIIRRQKKGEEMRNHEPSWPSFRSVGQFVPLAVLGFALSGCGTVKSSFRVNEAIGYSNSAAEIGCESEANESNVGAIKPINLSCFKISTRGGEKTANQVALECAEKVAAGDKGMDERLCRHYRNELQGIVMRRANAICDQHKGDILAQAALMNVGMGTAATGSSALGAVVSGVRAKTNLAAFTTFLSGTQALANQELYQKQFAGVLISAIESSRSKKKAEIDQKRAEPTLNYSIDDALVDVQDYHYRCAFQHGLSQITKAVERQDQASRAKVIEKIDALRSEIDKTAAMNLGQAEKQRLTLGLMRQIEDLQILLRATID